METLAALCQPYEEAHTLAAIASAELVPASDGTPMAPLLHHPTGHGQQD